jgi:beta-glucanase (GH16 family)
VRIAPQPAAAVAAPTALQTSITTAFSNLVASLSVALSGGAPTVPADASLALMLGAARRERAAVRTSTVAAAVPAATSQTAGATTTVTEAEKMTTSGAGRLASDKSASAGYAVVLSGKGSASTTLTLPEATALTLRVRAASGAPNMTLSIDGVPYTTLMINSSSYADYTFAGGIAAGTHVVSISSTTATTKNLLYVDKVTTSSGPIVEDFIGKSGSAPGRIWAARSGSKFDSSAATYASGNVFLDGQGHMVIQATRGKGGSYTSGWVWTKNSLSFGYGTVTARVKVPQGQGLWPGVWMMGADSDTLGWPASGEIDIAELPSTTTTVYSTLHGPITGSGDTQQAQIVSNLPDLSADYHNYWVTHLENEIIFGVDDQTLGTITPDDLAPGETWVYNRPMYMILNLAVGGSWAGAPDSTTPSTAKMMVESVTFNPS